MVNDLMHPWISNPQPPPPPPPLVSLLRLESVIQRRTSFYVLYLRTDELLSNDAVIITRGLHEYSTLLFYFSL